MKLGHPVASLSGKPPPRRSWETSHQSGWTSGDTRRARGNEVHVAGELQTGGQAGTDPSTERTAWPRPPGSELPFRCIVENS